MSRFIAVIMFFSTVGAFDCCGIFFAQVPQDMVLRGALWQVLVFEAYHHQETASMHVHSGKPNLALLSSGPSHSNVKIFSILLGSILPPW